MQVHVVAKNVTMTPSLLEFIERRIAFALGRLGSRAVHVAVRLQDVNGPRGGIDQQCRIDASVGASARRTVEGKGASVEEAVSQAVDRLAGAIRKDLTRWRTRRLRAARREGGPSLT